MKITHFFSRLRKVRVDSDQSKQDKLPVSGVLMLLLSFYCFYKLIVGPRPDTWNTIVNPKLELFFHATLPH